MMTNHQATTARRVLLALREHLRDETDSLVDAMHDLAIDARASRAGATCRSCRPTWRTVFAGILGSFVNELIFRKERTIDRIDRALERLDDGTYGVCRSCLSPMPASWLATIPYADRCMDCESQRVTDRTR